MSALAFNNNSRFRFQQCTLEKVEKIYTYDE